MPTLRSVVTLLGLTSLALLLGCGGRDDDSAAEGKRGTIGLSLLTLTNPFFKTIADSVVAEAERLGYDVIVTSGEFDVARQQNQVKDFIVKKVAAILLTPCDSKSIGPAIAEANAHWIPVFTADIKCLAPGVDVVSHIATDNYGGGREAARAMVEALEGRGSVAIVDFPEVESVIMRTRGFEDELAVLNERVDVNVRVVAKLPGGGARDKGLKATQDLLQSQSELDGIFCINDPSALGAVAALESAGRLDDIVIIGFDGQPEGKQAIAEGKIYADPIQFPDRIGTQAVQAIDTFFRGLAVPAEVLIPTALYRKQDAENDPELDS